MCSSYSFEVRAFDCSIRVATARLEAHTILERYTFPSLPRRASGVDKPDLFIRVVQVADHLQLWADGGMVASASRAISLVPDLVKVLDDAIVRRLTTLRAVHAGAVLLGERALLLPGITHAGKSSLVAELLRRGATYFSDEYALIDSEGRVHPYPRPLLLRNGSPEQYPVLPAECNARIGDTAVPVGWILSLEYLPEGTWSVESVSQSEALLILLRNTPHVLSESPDMVAVFQRAVSAAKCYAGCRPNANEAVSQILRLIGSPL
jgi:hypothetical protein